MKKCKCIGVKIVEAELMTKHGFLNSVKNEDIPSDVKNRPGYKVTYEDGYVSWSPKEVFDKAYRPIDGMTFGLSIEALKRGKKVARNGWNGKHMWLELNTGGDYDFSEIYPFIMINDNNNAFHSWSPSQQDLLAEDWVIINE